MGERLAKSWKAKAFFWKSRWFGNFPNSVNSIQKASRDWAEREALTEARRGGITQEGAFLTGGQERMRQIFLLEEIALD